MRLQHLTPAALSIVSVIARPALERRQASIVSITGATQGGVQPRLEIHELIQNEDQWNIYLLAIQAFQAMDTTDPLSWYQISGIHGVPYVAYNDVAQCFNCSLTGYCTHSSTLFPTWHRSYMALFEQSLQNNAIAVAQQFSGSDRERYLSAATTLRAPYWDWALDPPAGENPFPQLLTDRTVSVNTPTGQQTIGNPLRLYHFGSADHSFMQTSATPDSDYTVRHPHFTYENRQQLRSDLWIILTSNQGWNDFSTESLVTLGDNDNAHSLEMVHDFVHALVGGDMAYIPTAAYDPVFWLHHGMIDRAFALWQAAYPDDWIVPWSEVGSTYSVASGTVEDSQSDLAPFYANTAGVFWNSDALRTTTVLNYNYADLASGESAAQIINSLYRDSNDAPFVDPPPSSKRGTKNGPLVTEYIANIRADTMSTEGSFTIFFFDGDFDENDAESWYSAETLLGAHGFFTGLERKGDGNTLMNAGVSLNSGLAKAVKRGKLSGLDRNSVSAYLAKNLQWRVAMLDGTVVKDTDIPGLRVAITTSDVQIPVKEDELPLWGGFNLLPEVTKDRTCGYSG